MIRCQHLLSVIISDGVTHPIHCDIVKFRCHCQLYSYSCSANRKVTALVYIYKMPSHGRWHAKANVMTERMSRYYIKDRSTEVIVMHDIISDVAGMLHGINLMWGASRM